MRNKRALQWAGAVVAGAVLLGATPVNADSGNPAASPAPGAADFERALGVPPEGAGGGSHALVSGALEAASAQLADLGYTVTGSSLDYDGATAAVYVTGKTLAGADAAAAQSAAGNIKLSINTAPRTPAEADALQSRIDADRAALEQRGITVGTTGRAEDGLTVIVSLVHGTQADAAYLESTYGPEGLTVRLDGPRPYQPDGVGLAPPAPA